MKLTQIKKAGLVCAVLFASTSVYGYNKSTAKQACINKVTAYGSNIYAKVLNVKSSVKGHDSFDITGTARSSRDKQTHHFSCRIRHREVVSWHINDNKSHNNNSAAAIGVGVLALAIAAAANNNHKNGNHKPHANDRYKDHDSGGNPFTDIRYLKRQCKQNIRRHIRRDHGRISKISLDSAHLHHRELDGAGYIVFQRGGERSLNFNCKFDRRGKIYDGHYRFRRR